MRELLLIVASLFVTPAVVAQEEPEYRLEVGAGLGGVSYSGDFSGGFFKGIQPWMALVAKYRLNPRMALGFDIGTGKIKGSTADVDTWYPIEGSAPTGPVYHPRNGYNPPQRNEQRRHNKPAIRSRRKMESSSTPECHSRMGDTLHTQRLP